MGIVQQIYAIPDKRVLKKIRLTQKECFEYSGAITSAGYGCIRRNKKSIQAHRYVWELVKGNIPDGLHVLHKCDNRICINPDHIFTGTHLDNMRDAIAKGRHDSSGLEPGRWKLIPKHGEVHPCAKLSSSDVKNIRQAFEAGDIQQKNIASQFNISRAQVSRIVNNLTRKQG